MHPTFHKPSLSFYLVLLVIILATFFTGPLLVQGGAQVRTVGRDLLVIWFIGLFAALFQKQSAFLNLFIPD